MKRIRLIANECAYPAEQIDEHLIDTLIFGCTSESIKSKLLQEDERLSLDDALDIARTEEATRAQLQDLKDKNMHADAVQIRARHSTTVRERHQKVPANQPTSDKVRTCGKCGTFHDKDACPAKGSKCLQCGKLNHWKRVCRSLGAKPKTKAKEIHQVQVEEDPTLYFDMVEIGELGRQELDTQALISLEIKSENKNASLLCKLDTGAEGNVMPLTAFKSLLPVDVVNQDDISSYLKPSTTRIMAQQFPNMAHVN